MSAAPQGTGPTGPVTVAGKAKSSLNALTHGLTANTPLLPGEDAGEFRRFVWDIVEDLAPHGPAQAELAHRAALLMWKRRRVNDAEREVLYRLEDEVREEADDKLAEKEEFAKTAEDFAAVEACRADEAENGAHYNARQMVAQGLTSGDAKLERLARHEHRLDRQIDATIRLLLRLQNRKDWQDGRRAGRQARQEAGGASREPLTEGAPARIQPLDPPPPAPAQNELPEREPQAPGTGPAAPWTGPPGVN
jgi:hypothetical protein